MADFNIYDPARNQYVVINRLDEVTYTEDEAEATPFHNTLESCVNYYDIKGWPEPRIPLYRLFNDDRSLGQNQYASRYVDGRLEEYPNLGVGLRWKMGSTYHDIRIHRDDYEEFHNRVRTYRELVVKGEREAANLYVQRLEVKQ